MTTLFDDIVDGSGRVYFDELDESPGITTAAASAAVAISCSAAGVVVAAAAATSVWTAGAGTTSGNSTGVANAAVVISAANVPNQTFVYIPPTRGSVEIFAFASQYKVGVARASVVLAATAAAVTPVAPANAVVTIQANAQALTFGIAQAAVEVSGEAAGNSVDITTSPATASVTLLAGASPRQLATAAAAVALQANAVGTIASLVGIARAAVTISAQAAEAAGVIIFPRANATVSIGATAAGALTAAPVRETIPVVGKSIDFKTIADAYNSQQPPVPEYEFGYGKARRTFRRTGS